MSVWLYIDSGVEEIDFMCGKFMGELDGGVNVVQVFHKFM